MTLFLYRLLHSNYWYPNYIYYYRKNILWITVVKLLLWKEYIMKHSFKVMYLISQWNIHNLIILFRLLFGIVQQVVHIILYYSSTIFLWEKQGNCTQYFVLAIRHPCERHVNLYFVCSVWKACYPQEFYTWFPCVFSELVDNIWKLI